MLVTYILLAVAHKIPRPRLAVSSTDETSLYPAQVDEKATLFHPCALGWNRTNINGLEVRRTIHCATRANEGQNECLLSFSTSDALESFAYEGPRSSIVAVRANAVNVKGRESPPLALPSEDQTVNDAFQNLELLRRALRD